ncbi:NFAT activation molecule 1 [Salarias fasciatus]|uniref:NFAT activation molecule 1 n=1 Tax=Salarias fasciatus TaxID=181472 RepID=UPI001176E4C3|nr:NFAT activation molecule 1 [Salarias fasciatus]
MAPQQFGHFFSILTWMILIFLPFRSSAMDLPSIELESLVFVAFKGEDLTITGNLSKPANQGPDILTCFNPSRQKIYSCDTKATANSTDSEPLNLELKKLSDSGEYYCEYKTVKVHWFLLVRDAGYKEAEMLDYTEFIILGVVTAVLMVFSIVGSVYVFRGHWKVTKCGGTGKKQPQNREEKTQSETGEDKVDVTAQSSSFYASLEPRPASIYDVLDHSAANKQPEQKKAKPKKRGPKEAVQPNTEQPDEGVFECVYENF